MLVSVAKVVKETPDAATVYFDDPGQQIRYKPGQFVPVSARIDGQEVSRSYSWCTSPYLDFQPAITVKRVPQGIMSAYLVERLRPGDSLEIQAPRGSFTTEVNPDNHRHLILFAGGSGITPLLSLARSVLHMEPRSRVTLVYANRNPESIIFKDLLLTMQHTWPGRLVVIHVLKFMEDLPLRDMARGMQFLRGRLTPELVENLLYSLEDCPDSNNQYFICGPESFMQMVVDSLKSISVPGSAIYQEHFRLPGGEKTLVAQQAAQSVTLQLHAIEYLVSVPPNQTILQAAIGKGLRVPHSCREGLCGSCRAKLLTGRVAMDHNYALPDEELAEGYVLTCVGRPLTSDVLLYIPS